MSSPLPGGQAYRFGKKDRIFPAHGISIGYVGGEVKKRTGLKDLTI